MNEPGTPLVPTQAMLTKDLTGIVLSLDDLRADAMRNAAQASQRMEQTKDRAARWQRERGGEEAYPPVFHWDPNHDE